MGDTLQIWGEICRRSTAQRVPVLWRFNLWQHFPSFKGPPLTTILYVGCENVLEVQEQEW